VNASETVKVVVWGGVRLAFLACFAYSIVRRVQRSRRERAEQRKRIQDAIAKITADGKIEGPKGRHKPRRWARKWVRYANSLPAPRRQYEMSCRGLPDYPRHNE
jgi:hypothetical protein